MTVAERDSRAAEGVPHTATIRTRPFYLGVLRVAWHETLAFSRAQLVTAAITVLIVFVLARNDFTTALLYPLFALALLFLAVLAWNIVATPPAAARARAAERDAKREDLEAQLGEAKMQLEPGRAKRRLTEQLRKGEQARPRLQFTLGDAGPDDHQRLAEDAERLGDWETETEAVLDEEVPHLKTEFKSGYKPLLLLRLPLLHREQQKPPSYLDMSKYYHSLMDSLRAIIKQL